MKNLLKGLNTASRKVHEDNQIKGFYDKPRETGTLLMLIVSELAEALEADRKNKSANVKGFKSMLWDDVNPDSFEGIENFKQSFELCIKDSHEDEIADTIIRLMDYAGYKGIDLEWHIEQKLKYNKTRPNKHGKSY